MGKQFSIRESLKLAWGFIKGENLFLLIGLVLGYMVIYGILYGAQQATQGSFISLIVMLIQFFVSSIFSLGMIKISLQIIAGEEPQFSAFSDVLPRFLSYLGASILKAIPSIFILLVGAVVGFAMLAGKMDFSTIQAGDIKSLTSAIEASSYGGSILVVFLVALLPIIYLSVRWMFFAYLIVDKKSGTYDSLRLSWVITDGNFWHLVLFGLACFGLAIVGLVALILGIFVVMPLIMVAQTLIYKKLVAKLEESKAEQSVEI